MCGVVALGVPSRAGRAWIGQTCRGCKASHRVTGQSRLAMVTMPGARRAPTPGVRGQRHCRRRRQRGRRGRGRLRSWQSDSDSVGSSTLSSGYASELDADVSESDASDAEDDAEAMLCPPGQVMVPTFAPRVRRSGDDDADASDGRGQDRATLQAASADAPAPVPSADATPTAARHLHCSAPAALVETVRCGTARVVSPPRFWRR